tara:strand:+ start:7581 stop:7979 length:399 start_codon:yes stop_codon:yes gene_type:complete
MGMNRILIVEDDMLLALVEERIVKKMGYEVIAKASNAKDAFRFIDELKPDIILMDNQLLGELHGLDIVERMRNEGNLTPVVFISGECNLSQQERAQNLNCVDYLVKPIYSDSLYEPLERAVDIAKELAMYAA